MDSRRDSRCDVGSRGIPDDRRGPRGGRRGRQRDSMPGFKIVGDEHRTLLAVPVDQGVNGPARASLCGTETPIVSRIVEEVMHARSTRDVVK